MNVVSEAKIEDVKVLSSEAEHASQRAAEQDEINRRRMLFDAFRL